MSTIIARPTFHEGEILPAADLNAAVDYPRNQAARHARYLHSWGIASGLQLSFKSGAVTLSAGLAIDGTGREVVLTADQQLDPADFLSYVVPQTDTASSIFYPVYLGGVDQAASASTSMGACANSQPTSLQEIFQISYGAPGSELQVSGQSLPALTDPPDGGGSGSWQILAGFVNWNTATLQFSGAADSSPTTGIGRQCVGVNAAQVVSGSGSLLLATHPAGYTGANPVMAVSIQEKSGTLVFGKLGSDGSVTPALTVKASGDVVAAGQLSGAVIPGTTQVQSGVAFDGMILPLPVGIDPADAAQGKVTVYTHVTIHYEGLVGPATQATPLPFPLRCTVDSSTRQVNCQVRWYDGAAFASPPVDLPAPCDYVVIVAVPASQ